MSGAVRGARAARTSPLHQIKREREQRKQCANATNPFDNDGERADIAQKQPERCGTAIAEEHRRGGRFQRKPRLAPLSIIVYSCAAPFISMSKAIANIDMANCRDKTVDAIHEIDDVHTGHRPEPPSAEPCESRASFTRGQPLYSRGGVHE